MNSDTCGKVIDTVLDALFCLFDVVTIIIDPSVENFVALAADAACMAIPFATGGGLVARGVSATSKAIDAAITVEKAVDAASGIKKVTGSYEILFESGKNYVGKGGFGRAITISKKIWY